MRSKRRFRAGYALTLAAVLVTAAAGPGLTAQAKEHVIHQYVVSDDNADPDLRHSDTCAQEFRDEDGSVYQVLAGSELWDELELEHHDGKCYKVSMDIVEEGDGSGSRPGGDGEGDPEDPDAEGAGDGEAAAIEHGDNCWKVGLICDDDSADHVHGQGCTGAGWVKDHPLMDHDDDCKQHRKPSTNAQMFLNSLVKPGGILPSVNPLGTTPTGNGGNTESNAGPAAISNSDDVTYPHGDLPATGGAGTGAAVLFGIFGSVLGFIVLFATRRKAS